MTVDSCRSQVQVSPAITSRHELKQDGRSQMHMRQGPSRGERIQESLGTSPAGAGQKQQASPGGADGQTGSRQKVVFADQCTEHCSLTGCRHPPDCHRPSVIPTLSRTSEKLATRPKKLLYEKQAWLTGMCGMSPIKVDLLSGGDTSQSQRPFFYSKMLIKSDVCHHSGRLRLPGQPTSH